MPVSRLDPVPVIPAGEVQTNTPVDAFNPFNPFNQIISGGTRARIFDFGNRLIDTENEAWLATIGVKGDKVFGSNWGYDGAFRYSQIYTIAQIQTASASRFNRIMNANDSIFDPNSADFIGTTIPYNPFTEFHGADVCEQPSLDLVCSCKHQGPDEVGADHGGLSRLHDRPV